MRQSEEESIIAAAKFRHPTQIRCISVELTSFVTTQIGPTTLPATQMRRGRRERSAWLQCTSPTLRGSWKEKVGKISPNQPLHCSTTATLGQNFPNLKILGAAVLFFLPGPEPVITCHRHQQQEFMICFPRKTFVHFSGLGGGGLMPFSPQRVNLFLGIAYLVLQPRGLVIEHCNFYSFLIGHFPTWNRTFLPPTLFYFVSVWHYCVLCSWQVRILSNILSEEAYHHHHHHQSSSSSQPTPPQSPAPPQSSPPPTPAAPPPSYISAGWLGCWFWDSETARTYPEFDCCYQVVINYGHCGY